MVIPGEPSSFAGQRVVVTGAAGGIGAAIAAGFVARGASVVINDLDHDRLQRTAEEIGAVAFAGDAAGAEGVAALVAAADAELGGIDCWVANAGVGGPVGLQLDEPGWDLTWQVNTMAHVRAAQLLVPRWSQTGGGRFVVTASAAGLLTLLGGAAYSVTKHAAVAFAEWLQLTYAHRGISVHAICPQGVDTALFRSSEGREVMEAEGVLQPVQVADALFAAIESGQFFVLPHPQVADYYVTRATHPDKWLAGMNKLQQLSEA
ncbi:SDR family oxidoreductase [Naumannella halotolerans]|uniref:SDR family oxidoreductase n=1 Tax=Naumannella halotolerans TaxID=993414 RepID=UPI00370D1059